ncbi:hypothetical protein B0H13DRAFT_1925934 [Mycena leptocephala]|nr:hypothetical protein B0H13DRAFT_1925934 [Mycena leptocephala]
MNDLPLRSVGRNHADVCHLPPSGKPLKDIVLTLNLAVQVGLKSEDIEFKVYTPMDVDDLPVNVDEPRVYTPMDVDETWVTTWDSTGQEEYCHISMDGSQQAANTSDCQTKSPLSTSNQTFLAPSNFGQHRLQREWERWDSGTLQDQKLMYRKKWEIMRHSKQPLFPFQFRHIPWPILRSGERYPEINTPSVEYFIFGETRGTPPTEESKRLVKENLKLFHSDKFTLVLGRVLPVDREWARHGAEVITDPLDRFHVAYSQVGEWGKRRVAWVFGGLQPGSYPADSILRI